MNLLVIERANCVRVMLGESEEMTEGIWELSCNVDDMTGEQIGFAQIAKTYDI